MDRLNGYVEVNDTARGIEEYPTLVQMSSKAIKLLSEKYEDDGFVLVVEASQVDLYETLHFDLYRNPVIL